MLRILICFLIFSCLLLYFFYHYLLNNKVLFFINVEDKSKEKIIFIIKTLIFSIFPFKNRAQKDIILYFRKLGKVKIIGKDAWNNITIRFTFPNKESCYFLVATSDIWRMINGSEAITRYFMNSFNIGWVGDLNDLKSAVERGTVGNFIQNL